ncbi:protein of unknown function [Candidatus Bipolaricaulis anaerobius]|uniref:Uncharacterized protein n=1 Tax=Candidatus Bipolaricaulis anaerobius TaxID=2026885 RepID=A0A2X3KJ13_9BACT|nr:protein of unknown function [Candidatus Bipolaricaulis anaerobius]
MRGPSSRVTTRSNGSPWRARTASVLSRELFVTRTVFTPLNRRRSRSSRVPARRQPRSTPSRSRARRTSTASARRDGGRSAIPSRIVRPSRGSPSSSRTAVIRTGVSQIVPSMSMSAARRGMGPMVPARGGTLDLRRRSERLGGARPNAGAILAEGVGFEPTELSLTGFQDRRFRPLTHPSLVEGAVNSRHVRWSPQPTAGEPSSPGLRRRSTAPPQGNR